MRRRFTLHSDGEYVYVGALKDEGMAACALRNHNSPSAARTIAHDVVEHAVSHMKKEQVSFEEELRALGAARFIRDIDLLAEVKIQFEYLENSRRVIQPVPWIVKRSNELRINDLLDEDDLFEMFEGRITNARKSIRNALDHVSWGYLQKERFYDGNQVDAYGDFSFIEQNVGNAIKQLWYREAAKVAVYMDSHRKIWRERFFNVPQYR